MTVNERWAIEDLHLPEEQEEFVKHNFDRLKEVMLSNDPVIENLENKIRDLEYLGQALEEELKEKDATIRELRQEIRSLNTEIQKLEDTVAMLECKCTAAQERLEDYLGGRGILRDEG